VKYGTTSDKKNKEYEDALQKVNLRILIKRKNDTICNWESHSFLEHKVSQRAKAIAFPLLTLNRWYRYYIEYNKSFKEVLQPFGIQRLVVDFWLKSGCECGCEFWQWRDVDEQEGPNKH